MLLAVERVGADGQQHGECDVDGGQAEDHKSVMDGVKMIVVL